MVYYFGKGKTEGKGTPNPALFMAEDFRLDMQGAGSEIDICRLHGIELRRK